ncbi:MAG: DUF3040 domain-containing protein [Propionibacteriaceae bacterium]|jgi:protein-S-isoprenylcysteine O-methyltransferase Ste14|nr:DUF3040 domain-containing protein [Propionibacteriaceae bacterium]
MALSEAEQELLAKLEASLTAEDPKLAQKLAEPPARRVHPQRATIGVIGALVGIALIVIGLSIALIWLSVAGFVVMLVATIFFLTAWRPNPGGSGRPATRVGSPPPASPDFMSRLEQRWRQRQNPGGQ